MERVVRLAVVGTGDIGRRHIQAIAAVPRTVLSAVVEPGPVGREIADRAGVPLFATVEALLATDKPDGCIVATPNRTHVPIALSCLAAGVGALVEKPAADTLDAAFALADASERAGIPVLVGHHRRHNPIIQEARRAVREGLIGTPTAVQASFLVRKPDGYFDVAWRREPGGGPILINLIHDIDALRFIVGNITSVHGVVSNARRGNAVEDTAAALVTFDNGAVGTLVLSDTTPSPWSWELTAGERTSYSYPQVAADSYLISGTGGSLAVPSLRLWQPAGAPDWRHPMTETQLPVEHADSAVRQIAHFADVLCGRATPIITARDGALTLAATLAVAEAARTGIRIELGT